MWDLGIGKNGDCGKWGRDSGKTGNLPDPALFSLVCRVWVRAWNLLWQQMRGGGPLAPKMFFCSGAGSVLLQQCTYERAPPRRDFEGARFVLLEMDVFSFYVGRVRSIRLGFRVVS